jgi:hypothetical protein
MSAASKPRILLVLFNDTAAKGILDTRSIESLAAGGTIDLLHATPFTGDLKCFDRIYQWPRIPKRELPWIALYQLHLMPFTRAHYPERLGDQNLWQGVPTFARRLLKLLDNPAGRPIATAVLRSYLKHTNPLPALLGNSYDVVICVTGLKDPLYEDVLRWSRVHRIPVFAITQNWDNVNYKPIYERPEMLGVWGMQGYYVARLLHSFPHEQLMPVGAARMDVYFEDLPTPTDGRRELELPPNRPILLFAGAGPEFEETSLIEQLDASIMEGRLPSDLFVLYKPHPKRAPRQHELPLDMTRLRNIRIIPPAGPGSVPASRMPVLLRAVDAVVSPYSTMLLESALCGRPCLAMGYDDPAHPAIKWDTVRTYVHLVPLAFAPWALACSRKEAFISDVSKLLKLAGQTDLARRSREDALHVIFHDGRDFGARVADATMRLMKHPSSEVATMPVTDSDAFRDEYEVIGTTSTPRTPDH